MSGDRNQDLLDAIGLLTLRETSNDDTQAQLDYLSQVYDGNVSFGAGRMTAALAVLCEHLVSELADLRGLTREDLLRELAARFVVG